MGILNAKTLRRKIEFINYKHKNVIAIREPWDDKFFPAPSLCSLCPYAFLCVKIS